MLGCIGGWTMVGGLQKDSILLREREREREREINKILKY